MYECESDILQGINVFSIIILGTVLEESITPHKITESHCGLTEMTKPEFLHVCLAISCYSIHFSQM